MAAHPLLPDPATLSLNGILLQDDVIVFTVRAIAPTTTCPLCSRAAQRVHSHYGRTLLDLPWQGNPVRIVLTVRKFFCDNPACERRIFAERLPAVAARYARDTSRVTEALRELTYLAGGEAVARVSELLFIAGQQRRS